MKYINVPGNIPLHMNKRYKLTPLPAKMRNKKAKKSSMQGKRSTLRGFSRNSRIHRAASRFKAENIKITS